MKQWQQVLLIFAGLFVLSLVVLILTGNPNLFPAVVLVGSFAVPVAFVTFFWENRRLSKLPLSAVTLSFLFGGMISLLLAGIIEPLFIPTLSLTTLLVAAAIEEAAKILAVIDVNRRALHVSELDGIIIGASVGMGFAALESAGFSFSAFLATGGSLSVSVIVTLLRALLSPLGHGVWTAILAGILYLESRPYRFRLTAKVFLAFLGVTTLHWFWNSLPFELSLIFALIGELVVAVVGILILYFLWRQAKNRQLSE